MKYPPITDPLPDDINPGIVRNVQWLRSHGFMTCDSGDGATHMAECDRTYPYVCAKVAPGDLIDRVNTLVDLLRSIGQEVVPLSRAFNEEGGVDAPCIQASYDPADGVAIIDFMGVSDAILPADLP